jgi:predicted regulator of Ras-like GTPase activity (Roadblock/LC7/MglB family)
MTVVSVAPDAGITRTQALNRALGRLQDASHDVLASAVVTEDGLIIASRLPQGLDEVQIAAMSAALLSIAGKASENLRAGQLEQLYLKGSEGLAVITSAGPHGMVLVLTRKDAKLGLVFLEVSRGADEVRRILA